MNLFQVFLLAILVFPKSFCTLLDDNIIQEFCTAKNLTLGAIFTCMHKKDKVKLHKKLTLNKNYRFLFIDLSDNLDDYKNVLHGSKHHLAMILDGDCENISQIIHLSGEKTYFYDTYHWLFIVQSLPRIIRILDDTLLNINCDVNVVIPEENLVWFVYDVYNPGFLHNGRLVVKKIGYYEPNEGYKARSNENKYWTRRNMTGVQFKSAVVMPNLDKPLEEYLNDETNRQINSMHRFQSVTVGHCKALFNFSLMMSRTDSWGYIQSDGHFDGLVRLLEQRRIDFGSSPLLFKRDRLPVVDYSFGNWILRSAFIYRRPKVTAKSYEIFLRPLSKWVWICTATTICLIIFLLRIVFGHEQHVHRLIHERLDASWSFLFLFTLGAFCQQGGICEPKFFSSRILAVFVFIFCILIYQFYSASIVSYLLMDPPRTIFNLKDLAESTLRVGVEDILIDRNYFAQTTDPDAIRLYDVKIKGETNNSGFYTPDDGLKMVKNGGFAFHVETSTAYPIMEANFSNELICELEEIQMYRTQPMYTNLPKNSPFKEMMNFCMLKLVENGNMNRLRKYWDARTPKCMESAKKTPIHVTINEFSCGLVALAIGIALSLTFLAFEMIVKSPRTIGNKSPVKPFVN